METNKLRNQYLDNIQRARLCMKRLIEAQTKIEDDKEIDNETKEELLRICAVQANYIFNVMKNHRNDD